MQEGTRKIQKNGGNRRGGRARFKVVKIAMEPKSRAVPVLGWNSTTS